MESENITMEMNSEIEIKNENPFTENLFAEMEIDKEAIDAIEKEKENEFQDTDIVAETDTVTNQASAAAEIEMADLPKGGSKAAEDRKKIELAVSGDQRAYQWLMQRYRKSVYYLILRMVRNPDDAEDITQESFAKAFASLPNFDAKYAFSTWLFRIATNNSIDFIRKQKMQLFSLNNSTRNSDDEVAPVIEIKDNELIGYEKLMLQQRKELLQLAINQLPPRYRQLVELRYFREFSYEEVAEELKLPLGTVKAQLHRARELLNEALSAIQNTL
jgi:RNA polymerase sigma-70 factor (ECF subfamily)